MRAFLRGLRRNERPRPASTSYRSSTYVPLAPWQVREFLDRVADDLAAAYRALGDSRQETARIKDALRRWQSEQAQRANAGRYR